MSSVCCLISYHSYITWAYSEEDLKFTANEISKIYLLFFLGCIWFGALDGCKQYLIYCHLQCFLCKTLCINGMLFNKEHICSLYFEWNAFTAERAHNMHLCPQEHESNSLLSVCKWMGALITKLCLHWVSMYQLVVRRALWHWTWAENSLLNRVSSHHEPVYVWRTQLQLERGPNWNMLVIVVSGTGLQWALCIFVDLIIMSLGLVVDQTLFPATSMFLRVMPAPPSLQWAASLMTGLIPFMHAACV